MRRVIWNSWQSIGKLKNMKNQSFEVLCHKQIWNARRRSKEKSAMKHSWWQSCQPLLEHFLKSNLGILYVVSKLRKSEIQCKKGEYPCNNYYCNFHINSSREPVLRGRRRRTFCKSLKESKIQSLCSALLSHFDCIFHLRVMHSLRKFPQRMSN